MTSVTVTVADTPGDNTINVRAVFEPRFDKDNPTLAQLAALAAINFLYERMSAGDAPDGDNEDTQ